ncbi:c-type cytochrome [Roseicyclus mahoneyensis]|jgi:cytochrome c|uniref:Cytochrome c n=1 Tax=Roseicyclus mahoneyensis TaxID=164332 RepID=A0A316GHZ6_9RHOB|nr:cytochrome c family protein [Roseicyclus mahoneyensis]PWK60211.1 cytochrome c [Roseicyclus mahoneyensis]
MFDTMTITKAFASVCGGMLVLLLGGWAAESLYNIERHDDVRGFAILIEEEEAAPEAAEEVIEVAFADVYASADPAAGERLWRQCSACHVLEPGVNRVGPYLHGVVDRPKHAAEGFSYSAALMAQDGAWTPENLSAFLENPRAYAPGTAMAYNGMREVEDRANLIAYMATFQ